MRISDWSSDVCSSDLHCDGLAVEKSLDCFALRFLVADYVGMQEISMRKIDQIFQTDRRRAIKPDRSQHKARQPAFRRQKRQVWHMRDVRGLRPAEPYPDIALKQIGRAHD